MNDGEPRRPEEGGVGWAAIDPSPIPREPGPAEPVEAELLGTAALGAGPLEAASAADTPRRPGGIVGSLLNVRGLIGIAIVVGLVVVGLLFRDRLTGDATDLRVGDCFVEPSGGEVVTEIQHQPCNGPHDAEVIFVGDHPAQEAFPGEDAFDDFAFAQCVPAFESYVGRDYETDEELDFGVFYPIEEGWQEGDREITCYAYRVDEQPMTTSVKAAT